jgi:hypothetical protein
MEPGEPRAISRPGPLEAQVAAACAEAVTTVSDALRSAQAAALDVRDAIVALERLHASVQSQALQPETTETLRSALEHGMALMHVFDAMGLYDPIPIELL